MRERDQIILRHDVSRHEQRLLSSKSTNYKRNNLPIGELAGETMAECAAVACCPCGFLFLMILGICKYPGKMYQKLSTKLKMQRLRKKRREALVSPRGRRSSFRCNGRCSLLADRIQGMTKGGGELEMDWTREKEVMELEKEMWDQFCNTGFWRSHSQRTEHVADQMIQFD